MTPMKTIAGRVLGLLMLLAPGAAAAADFSIVGSSTVYPFMLSVAQTYAQRSKTKIAIEPTGTETGFDYFCAGTADYLPDINNASFAMTRQQWRACQRNGVRDIMTLMIGYDGLVVFTNTGSPFADISRDDLYSAIAAEIVRDGASVANKFQNWSEINPTLPQVPIRVLGPPRTSGTRLFIEEGLVHVVCLERFGQRTLSALQNQRCRAVRTDGPYVDVSEDDQFLIDAVAQANGTLGFVGYGQFQISGDQVRALSVDGVSPTFANIESQKYPLSRPLYVYVKIASLKRHPEIAGLLNLLTSDEMTGANGSLAKRGLIPPSPETVARNRKALIDLTPLECPSAFCVDQGR